MFKIYYHGDDRYAAVMSVAQSHCPGRSDCTSVFLCVTWELFSRCDTIISPLFLVKTYYTGDDCSTFILVASMERFHWLWTNRMYVCILVCLTLKVLLTFDPICCHNLTIIVNYTLQSPRSACAHLGWLDDTNPSALDKQAVRLYDYGLEFGACIRIRSDVRS